MATFRVATFRPLPCLEAAQVVDQDHAGWQDQQDHRYPSSSSVAACLAGGLAGGLRRHHHRHRRRCRGHLPVHHRAWECLPVAGYRRGAAVLLHHHHRRRRRHRRCRGSAPAAARVAELLLLPCQQGRQGVGQGRAIQPMTPAHDLQAAEVVLEAPFRPRLPTRRPRCPRCRSGVVPVPPCRAHVSTS